MVDRNSGASGSKERSMMKHCRLAISRYAMTALLTGLLLSTSSAGIDLDSLLRQTIGGEKGFERLASVRSYRLTGDLILNGQAGTFSLTFERPDHLYLMADLGAYSLTQAYDGKTVWQMDHNGSIISLDGYERKDFLRSVYLQSYAYLFDDRMPGSAAYDGVVTREGKRYHRIELYPFNSDTVTVYIDSVTAMQEISVTHIDNLKTVTHSSDFREVEGILFPFFAKSLTSPVEATSEFSIKQVIIDPEIEVGLFTPPVKELRDYHFPKDVHSVKIPFIMRRGLIHLTALVNGSKKVRLILDSGASGNVLDSALIESLDLPVVGTMPVIGIAGNSEISLVRVASIKIGELSLLNQVVGSMDLSGTLGVSSDSIEFGGLLGYDFLSRFPMLINYAESTLTVYNPDKYQLPDSGSVVEFYFTRQVPTVEATVNGARGDFIVDLGNAFGVVIHESFTKKHKLMGALADLRKVRQPMSGIGGSIIGRSGVVREFQVGDVTISSLRVLLADSGTGLTGSKELAGNIGSHFLQRFSVLLDYSHRKIVLYARDQTP